VFVDEVVVFDAGALAILGVLPSARKVVNIVRERVREQQGSKG
jgi:hypothetical protein